MALGQAELLEYPLEYAEGEGLPGAGQCFAAQQLAASEVGDGQRVAIAPIGEHELALVVGAPQIVGLESADWIRSVPSAL